MNPENPEDVKMFMDACSVEAQVLSKALYDMITAQPSSAIAQVASLDALASTAAMVIVTSTQNDLAVTAALMEHFIKLLKERADYYVRTVREGDPK